MKRTIIQGGTIFNEGQRFVGHLVIEAERIVRIGTGPCPEHRNDDNIIDATGQWVLPGVIDDQVHFREPGLTHKGDIHSESRAAVAGGVTSYMEMPNTQPPTTSLSLLEQKFERAAQTSLANYSFYLGATNDNLEEVSRLDPGKVCGVKLFMGSSTGNMLVDAPKALAGIFAQCPTLIATHCEDEATIQHNMAEFRARYGDQITPRMHPLIRSTEACYRSSALAVELADRYGAQLHVLHLSSAKELALFERKPLADKKITNEVCVHHLWFSDEDYPSLGNWIKWNPAIKTTADRDALRQGLSNGLVDMVATDHAPHTQEEKRQPYLKAPSGGPLVQHALVAMLELARKGVCTPEKVVEKMCHAPAQRFAVVERGYLREGYFADIVLVNPQKRWSVTPQNILARCGWSPFEGVTFSHLVVRTFINGCCVFNEGEINSDFRGKALSFDRP